MSSAITPQPTSQLAPLTLVAEQAKTYAPQAKATSTWRAYASDWRDFEHWCRDHDVATLPAAPETVALYLAAVAEHYKVSTLQRRIAAISQAHQAAQLETPTQSVLFTDLVALPSFC